MKQNEILSYIYDFTSILLNKTNNINNIILFGSIANKTFDKKSDVDLFIDINPNTKKKIMQKIVNDSINEFEEIASKKWHLRNINLPINCIIGNLNSEKWSELKREIISNGIKIYGKYNELPKNLKHNILFSFNTIGIAPKNKVKILRTLYGYKEKKEKKEYTHKGLLDEVNGIKLNPGTIIVPINQNKKIYDFFGKNKVKFKIKELWTE